MKMMSGGIASPFLTSAQDGCEWLASQPPVPTVQEAGRAPEPVRGWLHRRENSLATAGN
jgi:hypothetical protein